MDRVVAHLSRISTSFTQREKAASHENGGRMTQQPDRWRTLARQLLEGSYQLDEAIELVGALSDELARWVEAQSAVERRTWTDHLTDSDELSERRFR
jgi:hypothetical protein